MKVKPTPGKAVIKPEGAFDGIEGVEIPEHLKTKAKSVATVEQVAPPQVAYICKKCGNHQYLKTSCRHCGEAGNFRSVKAEHKNYFLEMVGKRVLYDPSAVVAVDDEQHILPIDDILAIIAADTVIGEVDAASGIKRCKFCGPAKAGSSNSMILQPKGGKHVCPRCGKDEYGRT